MMQIAVALYDRFTALDAVGPYEVLSRLPDSKLTFVGHEVSGERVAFDPPVDRPRERVPASRLAPRDRFGHGKGK